MTTDFDAAGSISFDAPSDGAADITFTGTTSLPMADHYAQPKSRSLLVVLFLLLIGGLAYLSFDFYVTGTNPLEPLAANLETWLFGTTDSPEKPKAQDTQKPPPAEASAEPTPAPPQTSAPPSPPANPYRMLPNRLSIASIPLSAVRWNAEQEEVWRQSMARGFNFEQFQTVQEVKASRLRGSDVILRDALSHKKLWVRMEALIGLAEFGVPIQQPDVVQALGTERPELVANYFRRYQTRTSTAIRYVIRQALPKLAAAERFEALKALAPHPDPLRTQYLVAALYDPDLKISQWADKTLARLHISGDEIALSRTVVLGQKEASQEAPKTPSVQDAAKIPEGEVAVAAEPATSEDLGYGEIKFYTEPTPAPTPEPRDILENIGNVKLNLIDDSILQQVE